MSVREPREAIHPVVGALFSTVPSGGLREAFGEEEQATTGDRLEPIRAAVSTPSQERAEFYPRRSAQASDEQSDASVIDSDSATGFARSNSRREDRVNSVADSIRFDEGERRGETAKGDRLTETVRTSRDYVPLIPTILPPRPIVVGVPVTMPSVDSPRPAVSPSRDSDEIEIHIGRIEVTAVHPTPLRTAPAKTPRRAPSLDDYLKQRDGRSS